MTPEATQGPGQPQRWPRRPLLPLQAPAGTGVSREAVSGLLIMGAGGGSLIILSLLLLRRKKPYGAISHGVVEVRDTKTWGGEEPRSPGDLWLVPTAHSPTPAPVAGGPHADPGGAAAPRTAASRL